MNEKKESAEVPRGRAQVLPREMIESPIAWLKGLRYVESLEDADKQKEPFGVKGVQLAQKVQAAGHEFSEKTVVHEPEGDVSHYRFVPKGGAK